MIDVRKVLKVCEQKDEFVLYFTAHNDADYNPVRKPEEGDYCAPYFTKQRLWKKQSSKEIR